MKYCPKCGSAINTIDAKFCSNCGFQLETPTIHSGQSRKQVDFQNIKSKKFAIPAITIIFIAIVVFFARNNPMMSNPVLQECVDLLGTSCENILNDNAYKTSSLLGITIAEKKTEDLFGVDGGIKVFILEYDEPINIVTWQSKENIELTDKEIATLVNGLKKEYGTPTSEDESLLWHTKDFTVSVKATYDEVYIAWADGDN